jgi:hypothetical protein
LRDGRCQKPVPDQWPRPASTRPKNVRLPKAPEV